MAEERQIQLRRDSVADWYSENPTPANGEAIVETDTHRLRVGDGTTAAKSLPAHQPISAYAATADVTLADANDYTHIMVTTAASDLTVTLPTAADNEHRTYVVKKVDSGAGTVTIDGEGAETVDGETTKLLVTQYSFMRVLCDGSEWHVIDFHHAPYDTGWISNSDWTNAGLTATHSFSTGLAGLVITFFLSSDGTDGNAIQPEYVSRTSSSGGLAYGYQYNYTSDDQITVQTGADGIMYLDGSGNYTVLTGAASYYYRILIYKLKP